MGTDPQSYDTLAEHYEHLTGEHHDLVAEWLPSVLPERRATAIDLGCVFSSAMLHHVRELSAALGHIKTLVTAGGRAALVDVTAPSNPVYRAAMRLAPRTYYRLGAACSLLPARMRLGPGVTYFTVNRTHVRFDVI